MENFIFSAVLNILFLFQIFKNCTNFNRNILKESFCYWCFYQKISISTISTQLVLRRDLTFSTLSLSIFCFLIIFKTFHCPKLVSGKRSAVKRPLISFFTRLRHVSMILTHGCKRTLKVIKVFQVKVFWNFSGWE